MKNSFTIAAALCVFSVSAFADSPSCTEYLGKMETIFKQAGAAGEQQLKMVQEQIKAIPAAQQEQTCKQMLDMAKQQGVLK